MFFWSSLLLMVLRLDVTLCFCMDVMDLSFFDIQIYNLNGSKELYSNRFETPPGAFSKSNTIRSKYYSSYNLIFFPLP